MPILGLSGGTFKFKAFTDKEGPCTIGKTPVKVEFGQPVACVSNFLVSDFMGSNSIRCDILAEEHIEGTSKLPVLRRLLQQGRKTRRLFVSRNGGQQPCPRPASGLGGLPRLFSDGDAEKVASYKIRLYESDKMPEKK